MASALSSREPPSPSRCSQISPLVSQIYPLVSTTNVSPSSGRLSSAEHRPALSPRQRDAGQPTTAVPTNPGRQGPRVRPPFLPPSIHRLQWPYISPYPHFSAHLQHQPPTAARNSPVSAPAKPPRLSNADALRRPAQSLLTIDPGRPSLGTRISSGRHETSSLSESPPFVFDIQHSVLLLRRLLRFYRRPHLRLPLSPPLPSHTPSLPIPVCSYSLSDCEPCSGLHLM
jgi:hypothetical protein